jgi:hypothetical protein
MTASVDEDKLVVTLQYVDVPELPPLLKTEREPMMQQQRGPVTLDLLVDSDPAIICVWHGVLLPAGWFDFSEPRSYGTPLGVGTATAGPELRGRTGRESMEDADRGYRGPASRRYRRNQSRMQASLRRPR